MRVMAGRISAVALAAVALAIAVAPSAAATDGSVPAVVTAYIANDLRADLNDFYGRGANGTGLDFDDSTTFSAADRIFAFVDDRKADIERLNEWETRVSIAKTLVGLAIVTIDAATSEPQLASFVPSAPLATALNGLPAEGSLVHDATNEVWLLVDGDTTTTLFSGTAVKEHLSTAAFPTPLIGVGIGVLIVVLVVALEIFMPDWRKRRSRTGLTSTDLLE